MIEERELLEQLFDFLVKRSYVFGEEPSIRDMVLRYKQPPLTMHHRIAMQMTVQDYNDLSELLKKVLAQFEPNKIIAEEIANEPA